MSDMPERIWAWPFNPGWGGYWRENPDAVKREDGGAIFIRADLAIDAMTLERAAQVVLSALNDAGDHPTAGAMRRVFSDLADAIRALAPEPAHVTAARVLLNSHTVQTMIAAGKRLDLEEVLRAIVEAEE